MHFNWLIPAFVSVPPNPPLSCPHWPPALHGHVGRTYKPPSNRAQRYLTEALARISLVAKMLSGFRVPIYHPHIFSEGLFTSAAQFKTQVTVFNSYTAPRVLPAPSGKPHVRCMICKCPP